MNAIRTILAVVLTVAFASACGSGKSAGSCEAGALDCRCRSGDLPCQGALQCIDGTCKNAPCEPGRPNCSCDEDGSCQDSTSRDEIIECENGTCVSHSCAVGALGCNCTERELCSAGLTCLSARCVPCMEGDRGCACSAGTGCAPGLLCVSQVCVREPSEGQEPPDAPTCYTPCQADLVLDDGTYVPCPADGLMPACVGNTTCVNGSCVEVGAPATTCTSDADCADYQACVGGQCYSNCEYDSDCPLELACYRKVCRVPCLASDDLCPSGLHCATIDGETGYCEPSVPPTGTPQRETGSGFTLLQTSLSFSNSHIQDSFTIVNVGPTPLEVHVRRESQRTRTDAGLVEVTEHALNWVLLGVDAESPTTDEDLSVVVAPDGGSAEIVIAETQNQTLHQWQGTLVVSAAGAGEERVHLSYADSPDGRWSGNLYYFTNFGDALLDDWLTIYQKDPHNVSQVGNAFIQRWAAFKDSDNMSLDEWLAVLTATQSESWNWPSTTSRCLEVDPDGQGACYLYSSGIATYSENVKRFPIPNGVVDFPFAMNLRQDPTATGPGVHYKGRIESTEALQYPGDPQVRLSFASDPQTCESMLGGACFVGLQALEATSVVGGRYRQDATSDDCSEAQQGGSQNSFVVTRVPWLVPGFSRGTSLDAQSGRTYRRECRNSSLPFADPAYAGANTSLSQGNPVPDGRTRKRTLELIDGALVNSDTLFIIFREKFEGFLSGQGGSTFFAYGYMLLQRSAAQLTPDDYVGSDNDLPTQAVTDIGATCSRELLEQLGVGSNEGVTATNAAEITRSLISGIPVMPDTVGPASFIVNGSPGQSRWVHSLCVSTEALYEDRVLPGNTYASHVYVGDKTVGYFDAGAAGVHYRCPEGSTVRYFVMDQSYNDSSLAGLACQQDGTCHTQLDAWASQCKEGSLCTGNLALDPSWTCIDGSSKPLKGIVHCYSDRYDLRRGKGFFREDLATPPVFAPLVPAVDDAFRYRTRFVGRTGTSLGFAPTQCSEGSNALPYCYDPPAIEQLEGRIDCLLSIFDRRLLTGDPAVELRVALKLAFGFEEAPDGLVIRDGFEKLRAELLIMLGDDAYVSASAARFDLAGAALASFEGTQFESNGINLSGGVGFEMVRLYQATQYYQLALDRFFSVLPPLWASLDRVDDRLVTLNTVTGYVDRLVRASGQKSRAWSEIAQRYQTFNRPDLARNVVARAYAQSYMESVILSQVMVRLKDVVSAVDAPAVAESLRMSSLGYRSALKQMRNVYDSLSDEVSIFGFAPDYVPFPALDANDGNAFDYQLGIARQKLATAAAKEELATTAGRSYEADSVSFQNELARLGTTYDNQLAELCGTFDDALGRPMPATKRYAYLNEQTKLLGDPCGRIGTGAIYQALSEL